MPTTAWNPSDQVNVTLSLTNLTAASTGSGAVRTVASASSGKYYWECIVGNWNSVAQVGIANATANLTTVASAGNGACVVIQGGTIYYNNTNSGVSLGSLYNNVVLGCAIDLGANLFWMRIPPSGNWNGSGTANPATGAGGISISAIATSAIYPMAAFSGSGGSVVASFGDLVSFTGTAPAGFTAGFPVAGNPPAVKGTPHRYWRLNLFANQQIAFSFSEAQFRTTVGVPLLFGGGTAYATESYSGQPPSAATDNNINTLWGSNDSNLPQYWWYDYGAGNTLAVNEVAITSRNDSQYAQTPSSFGLEYSDNSAAWASVGVWSATWTAAAQTQTFDVVIASAPAQARVMVMA